MMSPKTKTKNKKSQQARANETAETSADGPAQNEEFGVVYVNTDIKIQSSIRMLAQRTGFPDSSGLCSLARQSGVISSLLLANARSVSLKNDAKPTGRSSYDRNESPDTNECRHTRRDYAYQFLGAGLMSPKGADNLY
ncbi:hypothetical protein L596_021385 [Steinernema carpocapsae]|uniref:Uncharacterized protein n=1 Tax=Steinernema carpocapsae TaxID=34508 RepID=A0A4U5MIM9_STECR|nr:hypothetical protein L596_021385 [Steinernema carpocapsae]